MATFRLDELLAWSDTLRRRITQCAVGDQDRKTLMENWERAIEEDNREGVLAGLDKHNQPAPPLRYRPKNAAPMTIGQRLGQNSRKQRGDYFGQGDYSAHGLQRNNNLTTSEYRKLSGPRLAPRGPFSRVITNLATGQGYDPEDHSRWFAQGAWVEVVNAKGDKFLRYHFDGSIGVNRPYDLRGVRPAGKKKMSASAYEWAKDLVRRLWGM